MGLHELTLRNFRLFKEFTFTPDPDAVTVLLSPNGTGKTSILEAVHALATAASFRTTSAGDMIRNTESTAEVHGVLFQRERRVRIDLTFTRSLRRTNKRMLINGQRPRSRADLSVLLPLTVFTPEGVDVVRGGPENRREYLTHLLTDVEPSTGDVVERFHRILTQRNAHLRTFVGRRPSASDLVELNTWTSEFCEVSAQLLDFRRSLVARLIPLVAYYYQELSQDSREATINYDKSWPGGLEDALTQALGEDCARGYTTRGPHRDDLAFTIESRDARRQASQGEQRSFALALRLAGHELVRQQRGVDPLLLLDDVFSELDPLRSNRLLSLLPTSQTLVTTASPPPTALTPAVIIDLTNVFA